MKSKALTPIWQLALVTVLLGCASEPTQSPGEPVELTLVDQETVAQIPVAGMPAAVFVGPGESIRIRDRDGRRFLCANDQPMTCHRLGRNNYCSCPGSTLRE